MTDPWLILLFVAALVSCYFTALNYALLDFSRGRLAELLAERGTEHRLDHIAELRDDWLFVAGLVRTAANLAILWSAVAVIAPPDQVNTWWQLLGALSLAGGVIVVFGVAIPMSWSRYASEALLAVSMPILRVAGVIVHPIVLLLKWLDPLVRRLLGAPKPTESDHSPLEQEILDAVSEGAKSGLVDEDQQDMIEAVVEFPSITVEQIMTPRTDIEAITADASLDDVRAFIAQAGHSRIPIYEEDLDHIAGILYLKDLVPFLGANGGNGHDRFVLRDVLREALFVPETKPLADLLTEFKATKIHMAIVLDEYGGTAGLATIEDVLEEIVGEIHDEHEPPEDVEPSIDAAGDKAWEADGRVYIDQLNDKLDIDLPDEEDYDTVGGFVFAKLGHIPVIDETFDYENVRITVTDAEKTRVNRVRIELLTPDEANADTTD